MQKCPHAMRTAKAALRAQLNKATRAIPSSHIVERSVRITESLLAVPEVLSASSIGCFLSMPAGEVDTVHMISQLFKLKKSVFVPKARGFFLTAS